MSKDAEQEDKKHIRRIMDLMKEQFKDKGLEAFLLKLVELQWRIEKLEDKHD